MHKVLIVESDDHYKLFIPPWGKDRAKTIHPYQWCIQETCWKYPKTKNIYDALVHEFGDDISAGSFPPPPTTKSFQDIQNEFDDKIKKLEDENKLLKQSLLGYTEISNVLKDKDAEIENLRDILKNFELEEAGYKRQLQRARLIVKEYEKRIDELKNVPSDYSKIKLSEFLQHIAIKGMGGRDGYFERDVMSIPLDSMFCIEIAKKLHGCLTRITGVSGTLYEVIDSAKQQGFLVDEALDYVHVIRKQGNEVRHNDPDRRTYELRAMYSFVAAALLWPLMPEVD
ncbi:hypothetical protein [Solidesulfovibrio alcoholivorans]|uniref:hypothetical protein n=1 Tax=Solidesulfovibrio alcoholivorans TaxID=81406 RepID=UPI0012EB4416|nr:hypothetical protein [Solidesulfovibrio alcoholivorans]